jgi:hypothetical protein
MALQGSSTEALATSKNEYEAFLGDPERLKEVREKMATPGLTDEQRKLLKIFERTLRLVGECGSQCRHHRRCSMGGTAAFL